MVKSLFGVRGARGAKRNSCALERQRGEILSSAAAAAKEPRAQAAAKFR